MRSNMMDGKEISRNLLDQLKTEITEFESINQRAPMLVVIQIGHDPASDSYIRNKERACHKVGFHFNTLKLPDTVPRDELISIIDRLNHDDGCDGILVQLPLPSHLDKDEIIYRIAPDKDVDGFHPENIGKLWMGTAPIAPCTPSGIIQLLDAYQIDVQSKHVVIVGRSNIVGKPLAALLLARHATITIAHSRTKCLSDICQEADILVAAIGKPGMINADYIRPGAIVIDVGINAVSRESAKEQWLSPSSPVAQSFIDKGSALIGDVDPVDVAERASLFTPVPGGVGPMTVAMLLKNTLVLAAHRLKKP